MKYAPLQTWINESVVKTASVFQRGTSAITEYDPVMAGNVVPGEIDISDPGQIGRANLPSLHQQTNVVDPHVNDSVLPNVDSITETIGRAARWMGLRGGQYDPFTYTDVRNRTADYSATTAVAQQPFGTAGAGAFETEIQEHGPITVEELEAARGVRQPTRVRQRSLIRTLLFLPPITMDPNDGRDERIVPSLGQDIRGVDTKSESAVGVGNAFVIPDVRRTFDYPVDAPSTVPRDASDRPIYDNAGYWLTATALEGSDHEIQTSHTYPSFNAVTERPVGDSANRVRAGVQYDVQLTRPSVMPHWFDFRPFDKWADDHNYAFKGQIRPRIINRPIMVTAEPNSDDRWAAGRRYGAPPAGMNPIAVQPNIDRQAPQSWDAQLFQETPPNADHRASAWRLS